MIERTFDAHYINDLVNHPAIFPWVSFPNQSRIDLSEFVADPRHYAIKAPHGAFVFENVAPGDFEAHSLFLPEGRGVSALEAAQKSLSYMFTETGCSRVLARCPRGNLAVLAFARSLGFQFTKEEPNAWPTAAGLVCIKWFQMTRGRWNSLQEARTCP